MTNTQIKDKENAYLTNPETVESRAKSSALLYCWSIFYDYDSVQLESFCYIEHRTLMNLNSYGEVLLLSIFHFFILFYNNSIYILFTVQKKELKWTDEMICVITSRRNEEVIKQLYTYVHLEDLYNSRHIQAHVVRIALYRLRATGARTTGHTFTAAGAYANRFKFSFI